MSCATYPCLIFSLRNAGGQARAQDKEKGRGRDCLPRPGYGFRLENELAAELEDSRVRRVRDLTKGSAVRVSVQTAGSAANCKLCVVEGVECFGAELEVNSPAEVEGLVNRSVEVCAAGTYYNVSTGVAEAHVRTA